MSSTETHLLVETGPSPGGHNNVGRIFRVLRSYDSKERAEADRELLADVVPSPDRGNYTVITVPYVER